MDSSPFIPKLVTRSRSFNRWSSKPKLIFPNVTLYKEIGISFSVEVGYRCWKVSKIYTVPSASLIEIRFHQLSEFDQEKRSCRRRLAGHNERRRKPPPSSLLTSRYGQLTSPIFDNSGRVGGFLMELAAYPKLSMRNELPIPISSELLPGNQTSTTPWQGNLETSSELFLRGSVGGISYPGPRNPPGESFAGITDSSCALSLLSSQTWGPRNRAPSLGVNNLYFGGTPMTQLTASSHGDSIHQLSNPSWYFKGIDAGSSSHEVVPDLGLAQISQPLETQHPGGFVMSQQNRRQYMDLEQSRAYESSQLMNWSL